MSDYPERSGFIDVPALSNVKVGTVLEFRLSKISRDKKRVSELKSRPHLAETKSTGLTQLAQGEEDFFHHLALDK